MNTLLVRFQALANREEYGVKADAAIKNTFVTLYYEDVKKINGILQQGQGHKY